MDYRFLGEFNSSTTYMTKDIVSYASGEVTYYYMCLKDDTIDQVPVANADSIYWGLMNTNSNFPNELDNFVFKADIQASDQTEINRIVELKRKTSLTPSEQNELNTLTLKHKNKFQTADDINKMQDSLMNLQLFFKDKVEGRLEQRLQEINTYLDGTTAGNLRTDIGVMADLTTTNKSSLVKALNEVNNKTVDLSPIENQISTIQSSINANNQSLNNLQQRTDVHINDATKHIPYAVSTGSVNSYNITLDGVPSYQEGLGVAVKIHTANTGTSYLNINGLGNVRILKPSGSNLLSNDLMTGAIYTLRYSESTFFLQASADIKLNNTLTSTSTTEAATAYAVKQVNDKFYSMQPAFGQLAYANTNGSALGGWAKAEGLYSVAIGYGALSSNSNSVSIGLNSVSTTNSIAIGKNAKANNSSGTSIAIGQDCIASGYRSMAIGDGSSATGFGSVAIGAYVSETGENNGRLGGPSNNSSGVNNWIIPGNLSVSGTKNFEIAHPHPDKKDTHVIRHGAVESPTTGDTLYRYTVEATEPNQIVEVQLPDYFEYLNTNVDVWVNPHLHFGRAFGVVERDRLKVTCETAGKYKVLIIGTRNDENVRGWYIKGVERHVGENWKGETSVIEVTEITEEIEIKE